MPVLALLVVGFALAAVLDRRDAGHGRADGKAATAPAEQPAVASESPRARPPGTVCDGMLQHPAKGQPAAFAPEYTKTRQVLGITIVASESVDDRALDEAEKTLQVVFAHNDLEQPLAEQGAYVIIAAAGQGVLDLPEFACLAGQVGADFFTHVCGVADRADYPVATVNELDLLGDRKGPCRGLNILYHEVGHLVQGWTLSPADYMDARLAYQAALDAGRYRNAYAAKNYNEYFAEATQSYFLYGEPGGGHDRRWLQRYDPEIFKLLQEIYGE
jgi:hypothetical protein